MYQREFELDELSDVAVDILKISKDSRIFCLKGDLGAGKTTLVESICHKLARNDQFSSPTFSILNEYAYPEGIIMHADLYRIQNREELIDIGLDDYLDRGDYCFIEWYQVAETMLPTPYYIISLEYKSEDCRLISIELIQ
jgi:tRNA threonylcarbamoyladenosine biosynthesis protein TsaE